MCRQKFLSDAAACLSVMFGSRVLFMLLMLAMGMPFPRDLRAQQVTAPGVAAISELRVLPGHERDVERAVEQVREATLKDPGCAYSFVTTLQGDSTTIFLFERSFGPAPHFRNTSKPHAEGQLQALKVTRILSSSLWLHGRICAMI